MALGRRAVYATLAVAAGVVLALSVLLSWNWPLMNGVRAGIIALGLTGMLACSISGWAQGESSIGDPLTIAGIVVGVLALLVALIGLFVGTTAYLVFLLVAIVVLWAITVLHRLITPRPARHVTAA